MKKKTIKNVTYTTGRGHNRLKLAMCLREGFVSCAFRILVLLLWTRQESFLSHCKPHQNVAKIR